VISPRGSPQGAKWAKLGTQATPRGAHADSTQTNRVYGFQKNATLARSHLPSSDCPMGLTRACCAQNNGRGIPVFNETGMHCTDGTAQQTPPNAWAVELPGSCSSQGSSRTTHGASTGRFHTVPNLQCPVYHTPASSNTRTAGLSLLEIAKACQHCNTNSVSASGQDNKPSAHAADTASQQPTHHPVLHHAWHCQMQCSPPGVHPSTSSPALSHTPAHPVSPRLPNASHHTSQLLINPDSVCLRATLTPKQLSLPCRPHSRSHSYRTSCSMSCSTSRSHSHSSRSCTSSCCQYRYLVE